MRFRKVASLSDALGSYRGLVGAAIGAMLQDGPR